MDTDTVRLFILAAEKLNISAAGRELDLAPAVASARLAKLERALGTELLHRSTRKVSLSIDGSDFLPYARELIAQEDAARAALGLGQTRISGTLRFAASSSFAQLYVVPILPRFLEMHPGIDLDLRLSDTPLDMIEGSFDLALRSGPLVDSSLKGRKLADDTRVMCASPAYLARHGTPHRPGDLADHRLIAFRHQSARRIVSARGESGVYDPGGSDCRVTVDDGASQMIATRAGIGISMNSLWCVHPQLSDGTLVRVLPDYVVDDRSVLWLVYPKSNVLTAKVRVFIDFLFEEMGREPPWTRT